MSDALNAPRSTDGDDSDDLLLAELRALSHRVDPVPADALAAARSAIAWRTMDHEIATLIDESSEPRLADVRSADTPTLLVFESQHLLIEIEVRHGAGSCSLLGQIVPPQVAEVEVRHRGDSVSVTADASGRFSAGPLAPGPTSVRCTAGVHMVETDWIVT